VTERMLGEYNDKLTVVEEAKADAERKGAEAEARGAFHQLLSIILKLRILVLLPVSNLPYVGKVKNHSLFGE
jgi:hypothetical protein